MQTFLLPQRELASRGQLELSNPSEVSQHIAAADRRGPYAPFAGQASTVEVFKYHSRFDLRDRLMELDRPELAFHLTVVLMLGADFRGHLGGLIRRKHPGLALRLASASGKLPGLQSAGDLALHATSWGWHWISFHRSLADAVQNALRPVTWPERCVMFYPEERDFGEDKRMGEFLSESTFRSTFAGGAESA